MKTATLKSVVLASLIIGPAAYLGLRQNTVASGHDESRDALMDNQLIEDSLKKPAENKKVAGVAVTSEDKGRVDEYNSDPAKGYIMGFINSIYDMKRAGSKLIVNLDKEVCEITLQTAPFLKNDSILPLRKIIGVRPAEGSTVRLQMDYVVDRLFLKIPEEWKKGPSSRLPLEIFTTNGQTFNQAFTALTGDSASFPFILITKTCSERF